MTTANPSDLAFFSFVLRAPSDFTDIVWCRPFTRAEAEASAQANADVAGPGTTCKLYEGITLRGREPVFTATAKVAP